MAPASDPQRPCREPLYDIDPATGVCIEIGSHAGDVRKVRCRLVLVATPTRLFTRWFGQRAVRCELRSVSACDEFAFGGDAQPGEHRLTHSVNADTVRTRGFIERPRCQLTY